MYTCYDITILATDLGFGGVSVKFTLHGFLTGENQLTELPLAFESLEHLATYAAPLNRITVFERGLGCCQQLQV